MQRGRWILLALVVVLAFPVSLHAKDAGPPAGVKDKFDEFEGTEIPVGDPVGGSLTFTPGGALHLRGVMWKAIHEATDARVAGVATIVVNCNESPQGKGHCWGTMHVEPCEYSLDDGVLACVDDPNGAWEATWHSPQGRPYITAVGYGTGEFQGLKAWWTFDYSEGAPAPISGRILDPHGK